MDNIIAIYGGTCCLKDEVAHELSQITGFKLANRGEWAITQAKYTRTPTPGALPEEFHRALDEETRRMAERDEKLMIFESAFIDEVLRDKPNVYLVHVRSDEGVREQRWKRRKEEAGGRTRQLGESLAARDREDAELRRRLYGSDRSRASPVLDIDTTQRDAVEVALQIWEAFEKLSGIRVVTHKPAMDKGAARGISPGPATGVLSRYSARQPPFGGYIADDKSGKEIYVHKSAMGEGLADPRPGQRVAFEIVADSFGGFKAVKVRAV